MPANLAHQVETCMTVALVVFFGRKCPSFGELTLSPLQLEGADGF